MQKVYLLEGIAKFVIAIIIRKRRTQEDLHGIREKEEVTRDLHGLRAIVIATRDSNSLFNS